MRMAPIVHAIDPATHPILATHFGLIDPDNEKRPLASEQASGLELGGPSSGPLYLARSEAAIQQEVH